MILDSEIDIFNVNNNKLLTTPPKEKKIFFDTKVDILNST